ncbi:hypothetical protein YH65_10360 [Sulfurovum lithotrophicum]|uniref:Cytochrome c domain-containing protein n=1 Tax=Sulfurovum lithotrophicum TaxID=206403 RepID=A0A7U4M307_9BACT|nr:c-type cytochrome [Sulfurovum lithotrophicum]AKF25744.1 hypothetical protein YH65_10360 [Sulfurovum lithotrophicum]
MKRIVIAALLAGSSLMAADTVKTSDSGTFATKNIDGAAIYKRQCAICHGEKGEKSPAKGIAPLAGRDATILALRIRAYRDQDNDIGTYTMHKSNEVMKFETIKLSDMQIGALAKYISSLK